MRWRRATRGTIGLDIGSQAVTLVAIRHTASGPRVEAVASADLPAGALHGHLVREPAAVGDSIRRLLRTTPTRGWPVVTAVPAPAVMMRRLTVAAGCGAECDAAVVREAAAFVPDGLDHAVLDYHLLGSSGGAAEVLAVAARRELIRSYTAAVRAAGVEPCAVDVDAFALHRAWRTRGAGQAVVLLHVGARTAAVTLVRDDLPVFAGDVSGGPAVAAETLAAAVARVAFDGKPAWSAAVLAGLVGRAEGLDRALARRLHCPVGVLDPFAGLACRAVPPDGTQAAFGVAVGLGLRRPKRPWW